MRTPIAEGGYGCVFYPGFDCNGDKFDSVFNSISKIVVKDMTSLKEIENSEYIHRIPNFISRFLPVVNNCSINHVNLLNEPLGIRDCSIVNKSYLDTETGPGPVGEDTGDGGNAGAESGAESESESEVARLSGKEYVILEIPYLKNNCTLGDLMYNKNLSLKDHILIIFETYRHLLKSLSKLRLIDFVHYDLNIDNVLYSKTTGLSYIIDFGLSIPYEKLNQDTWRYHFYAYAATSVWSLEIQTINYLIRTPKDRESDGTFHISDGQFIAENYTKKNGALLMCTEKFRNNYQDACVDYLSQYDRLPKVDVIKKLLETRGSWDLNSLSILFLRYIHTIFVRSKKLYVDNRVFVGLCQIFLTNINPYPNKRFSIEETEKRCNELLMGEGEADGDAVGGPSKLLDDYLSFTNYLASV